MKKYKNGDIRLTEYGNAVVGAILAIILAIFQCLWWYKLYAPPASILAFYVFNWLIGGAFIVIILYAGLQEDIDSGMNWFGFFILFSNPIPVILAVWSWKSLSVISFHMFEAVGKDKEI